MPPKPPLLTARGDLTVANKVAAPDEAAYARAVRVWADTVWQAYAPQNHIARAYLAAVRAAGPLLLPGS